MHHFERLQVVDEGGLDFPFPGNLFGSGLPFAFDDYLGRGCRTHASDRSSCAIRACRDVPGYLDGEFAVGLRASRCRRWVNKFRGRRSRTDEALPDGLSDETDNPRTSPYNLPQKPRNTISEFGVGKLCCLGTRSLNKVRLGNSASESVTFLS